MAYVYLFRIGEDYDSPDITRIFKNYDDALKEVPSGFVEQHPFEHYYAHNGEEGKWLTIEKIKLE